MSQRKRVPLEPGRGYEIRGGTFENRIVTIGAGDVVDIITDGAVFRDCELKVQSATRQSLDFLATFVDCEIRTSKPLRNRQMERPTFVGCTFTGQYFGCEFGPKFLGSVGRVDGCDFSGARLSLTEIFDCELESMRLPDWPHIYLLYGEDLGWTTQLPDGSLPHRLLSLIRLPRHESVTPRSILSVHLPSFDCDPEALWPLIQDIPQIWFPSKLARPRAVVAPVEKALADSQESLAKRQRTFERTAIFGNLHRAWLKSATRTSNTDLDLLFDCSFLREKVPEAPEEIRIRLHQGSAVRRLESTLTVVEGELDRFMLMGVGEEGGDVILKPHRKERGQVILSFDSLSVLGEQGQPEAQELFLKVVNRYYFPDES